MPFTKFKKLFSLKFKYGFPKKNDIMIYDDNRSKFIKRYLKNHSTYFNRFESSSYLYLPILLKCLFNLNLNFSNYKKFFIEYVNPKVIITSNDNQLGFFRTKKLFPKIKFVAIQGFWKFDLDHDIIFNRSFYKKKDLNCDFFLCYNKFVASEYKRFINCKNFISIGSFESNSFPINKKKNSNKKIIFISQFKNQEDDVHWHKNYNLGEWKKEEIKFLYNIKEFIPLKEKITVIGKSSSFKEKNYYKKIFGNKLIFIKNDRLNISRKKKIFKYLDKSELIITLDSSLGYEALARGNKVIFFSIRNNLDKDTRSRLRFCWPNKKSSYGLNWTNLNNKKEIKRLFQVRKMKQKKWNDFFNKEFKDICVHDEKNKQFLKLLSKIKAKI